MQDHGDEDKHKIMMIRRSTRPWEHKAIVTTNTRPWWRPWWLGRAQDHNNWEKHQHHSNWEEHKITMQPRGTPTPWQLGEQDHGDKEEHKTTTIRRNTKTAMIRRNTTLGQLWKSQDHGDEEERKITTTRRKTMVIRKSTKPQGAYE